MSLLSVEEIIELGDVSTYLSLKYKDEGKLFGAKLDGISPKSIAIVNDALRWRNESFPNIEPEASSCTVNTTGGGDQGDYITLSIDDPIYGSIELCYYELPINTLDQDYIASAIANVINSNQYGYSATAVGQNINVYGRQDIGGLLNGQSLSLSGVGQLSDSIYCTPFTGGVDGYNNGCRKVANYLYWMCGKFQIEAQFIIQGVGGGTVTTLNPFIAASPLEFTVSESSVIPDGGSSATLTSFIGYNILFMRNNIPQSKINNGGSYFSWNKTTGLFTISQPAYTGELFQIYPFI